MFYHLSHFPSLRLTINEEIYKDYLAITCLHGLSVQFPAVMVQLYINSVKISGAWFEVEILYSFLAIHFGKSGITLM
jgi:hypothetical protein